MLRGKQISRHIQNLSLELRSHRAEQHQWSVHRTNWLMEPYLPHWEGKTFESFFFFKTCAVLFYTIQRPFFMVGGNGAITSQDYHNSKSNSLTPVGHHSQFATRPPAPTLIYSTQHHQHQQFTQRQAHTNLCQWPERWWEEITTRDSGRTLWCLQTMILPSVDK